MIKDFEEDGARKYRAGVARRWLDPDDSEKQAIEIISDFDGWLEHLYDDQVKEIVRSIARALP